MKRIQIQMVLLIMIGMVLTSIPNVKGECSVQNQKYIWIYPSSPNNQTTIYGTSVSIQYGISASADEYVVSATTDCIENFTVYNPSNVIIFSVSNQTINDIGNKSYTYAIPNSTQVNTQLRFRFYLTYNINGSVLTKLIYLVYIYGGLTEPTGSGNGSINDYTVYIIIGLTVLFAGVFIFFIASANKKKEEELPSYCNAIDPMTMKPFLYTDMVCREKYLKKVGRLPEEMSRSPPIIPQPQPQYIPPPIYIPPPQPIIPIQPPIEEQPRFELQPLNLPSYTPPPPPKLPKKKTLEEI